MSADARVAALGIELPELTSTAGNYVRAKRAGGLCFLSGAVSAYRGRVLAGVVGGDRSADEGYAAARACGMTLLAALKEELGTLDKVDQVVNVTGYIHAARGFEELPKVMDGFSDLMMDVFGEAGKHARASVGVSALPRGAMVEVAMVVAVRE
jgi:enamine deaminase RidA (YjgF/YER057c/UK114 family)